MRRSEIIVNAAYRIGEIDPRLYGSFLEHMGRVIYSGVYEPEHPMADEDGFRKDVLEAVKNLGITQVRYPGGNFVSCYHWEDGVGPREKRPCRLELAWRSLETNAFGTDEYMKWMEKIGAEPMLAVNLGSRGMEEAVQYLEYCNFPGGTKYSDLRRLHGREQPYGVRLWCLGNEMDGGWQIGHKTAEEYGRIAGETAKVMKRIDPEIQLTVCGSSLSTMDTFPQWEETVLMHTYEYADYISLHQYFGGQEKGTEAFLAQADEMDRYIKTVTSVCDVVKAKKRSSKQIYISFDEWGVWAYKIDEVTKQCGKSTWKFAPQISEMVYTFEDALLFGGMLLALLKNSDRVKLACQSLLTNISAMIMTEKGGGIWYQTIYYPFLHVSRYGRGTVMDIRAVNKDGHLDCVVVKNSKTFELIVFAINRDIYEEQLLVLQLQGFEAIQVIEHIVMESSDLKAVNSMKHTIVRPHSMGKSKVKKGTAEIYLPKISWNVVRFKVEEKNEKDILSKDKI